MAGSGLGPGFQGRDGSGAAPARLASLGFLRGAGLRNGFCRRVTYLHESTGQGILADIHPRVSEHTRAGVLTPQVLSGCFLATPPSGGSGSGGRVTG